MTDPSALAARSGGTPIYLIGHGLAELLEQVLRSAVSHAPRPPEGGRVSVRPGRGALDIPLQVFDGLRPPLDPVELPAVVVRQRSVSRGVDVRAGGELNLSHYANSFTGSSMGCMSRSMRSALGR